MEDMPSDNIQTHEYRYTIYTCLLYAPYLIVRHACIPLGADKLEGHYQHGME